MQSSSSNYFSNGGRDGGSPHIGVMGPSSRSATFSGNGPLVPPPIPQYRDMHNGPRPRDPGDVAPSPPSSVARTSEGTGLNSDSGYGSLKGIEEERIHHTALEKFLTQDPNDRNQKQKTARDKLLRLSKVQFQELSTDVYDELQRRQLANDTQSSGSIPPHLPPNELLHPKRNQARMKLSTLPMPRFKELARDVFDELDRRYPHLQDLIIL